MKDAYSFDIDAAGLDKSFDLHDAVYRAIFTHLSLIHICGLCGACWQPSAA